MSSCSTRRHNIAALLMPSLVTLLVTTNTSMAAASVTPESRFATPLTPEAATSADPRAGRETPHSKRAGNVPTTNGSDIPGCFPSNEPPRFIYGKGEGSGTENGGLALWVTIGGCRFLTMGRAGSGLPGVTDDCSRARGNLPNGGYDIWRYYDKSWGSHVVRGRVWHLSNKRCSAGKITRKALFIHSNGKESNTFNARYTSLGCIKISQNTRRSMADYYRRAQNQRHATLIVHEYPAV